MDKPTKIVPTKKLSSFELTVVHTHTSAKTTTAPPQNLQKHWDLFELARQHRAEDQGGKK